MFLNRIWVPKQMISAELRTSRSKKPLPARPCPELAEHPEADVHPAHHIPVERAPERIRRAAVEEVIGCAGRPGIPIRKEQLRVPIADVGRRPGAAARSLDADLVDRLSPEVDVHIPFADVVAGHRPSIDGGECLDGGHQSRRRRDRSGGVSHQTYLCAYQSSMPLRLP